MKSLVVAYCATLIAFVGVDFVWLSFAGDRLYRPDRELQDLRTLDLNLEIYGSGFALRRLLHSGESYARYCAARQSAGQLPGATHGQVIWARHLRAERAPPRMQIHLSLLAPASKRCSRRQRSPRPSAVVPPGR